jgi:hypothetical protein
VGPSSEEPPAKRRHCLGKSWWDVGGIPFQTGHLDAVRCRRTHTARTSPEHTLVRQAEEPLQRRVPLLLLLLRRIVQHLLRRKPPVHNGRVTEAPWVSAPLTVAGE